MSELTREDALSLVGRRIVEVGVRGQDGGLVFDDIALDDGRVFTFGGSCDLAFFDEVHTPTNKEICRNPHWAGPVYQQKIVARCQRHKHLAGDCDHAPVVDASCT